MDLNTIDALSRPRADDPPASWRDGDAWLAGGTWIFSEPQPDLRRLLDLSALDWPALRVTPDGLQLAATCTFATLAAFAPPPRWRAGALIRPCCEALLGSFKIWNVATIGGNLCLALPAGPVAALAIALDATCRILMKDQPAGDVSCPDPDDPSGSPSRRERTVPAAAFIRGTRETVLRPGELLRSLDIPAAALERRAAMRRASLTPLGRSAALLIGTLAPDGAFALTVTASTDHPVHLAFPDRPGATALQERLADAIPDALLVDDVHGRPDWRRHMTCELAESIRRELSDGGAP